MENFYLGALIEEVKPQLLGRRLARAAMSTTTAATLLLDFELANKQLLCIRLEPSVCALYFQTHSWKQTNEAPSFVQAVGKSLIGRRLTGIWKPPFERLVLMDFEATKGQERFSSQRLVLRLSGRTANVYLTDQANQIEAMWKWRGEFQPGESLVFDQTLITSADITGQFDEQTSVEEILASPIVQKFLASPQLVREFHARCAVLSPKKALETLLRDAITDRAQPLLFCSTTLSDIAQDSLTAKPTLKLSHFPLLTAQAEELQVYPYHSLSDAGGDFYRYQATIADASQERLSTRRLLQEAIHKLQKLLLSLREENAKFENPGRFKTYGDLLLANLSTATVSNAKATVTDYFDERQPLIEIPLGEAQTLQQAANHYFARYQKARRALTAIQQREAILLPQLDRLSQLSNQLETATTIDEVRELRDRVENLLRIKKTAAKKPTDTSTTKRQGRWYQSTSGDEIVVGKNDRDNDTITFRLARPQDLWLHAADYPGSHVLIRNPRRQEISGKTIQEAAELAAFYSQGKSLDKVAVHYTQKKFVTKPPRAKPGLVRLSSFKTILVEPRCNLEKIEN